MLRIVLRNLFCLLVLMFLSGPKCLAKELLLVEQGRSTSTIIVSSSASQTELFAAAELQKYLLKISTATVPIKKDTEQTNSCTIHIGNTNYVNSLNLDLSEKALGNDGFIIKTAGNHLILIGRQQRGTLFSVYAFLERLGCRWWAPAFEHYQGNHELVPTRKTIKIKSLDIVEKPAFKIRMDEMDGKLSVELIIDWIAKVRKNTVNPRTITDVAIAEAKKRGLLLNRGGHHDFRQHLPPSTYFADHPEWYSYKYDGLKTFGVKPFMRGQRRIDMPCSSADDAIEVLAKNYMETVSKSPEIDIFCPWPPDNWPYCNCEKCKTIEPNRRSLRGGPSGIKRYLKVIYPIIRRMKENHPQKMVMPLIYSTAQDFPQEGMDFELMRNSNFMLFWCNFGRDWRYPLNVSEKLSRRNYSFFEAMKAWMAKGIDVLSEDVYIKYMWVSMPVIKARIMLDDLRSVHKIGVKGVSIFDDQPANWYTYEINHYVHSTLAWNPYMDIDEVLTNYCKGRYGKSSQQMKNYFINIEKAMAVRNNPMELFGEESCRKVLEYLDKCSSDIAEAIKLCEDNATLKLIKKNQASLKYATLNAQVQHNIYLHKRTKN
ncbi:MAG: DUF4838 domain-containing protein, partial [Planctomycetota bacterium]